MKIKEGNSVRYTGPSEVRVPVASAGFLPGKASLECVPEDGWMDKWMDGWIILLDVPLDHSATHHTSWTVRIPI